MATVPDPNPPVFSPSLLSRWLGAGPRYGAMSTFHGKQLDAEAALHIVAYRNAVEAKRAALPAGVPKRRMPEQAFLSGRAEHAGDTKYAGWRWHKQYGDETNARIIAGKAVE